MSDLALHAPGPVAPAAALDLLRELATARDPGSLVALTRVIATELALTLPTVTSPEALLAADDVPGFLKVYLLAHTPARLLAATDAPDWAKDTEALDFDRFHALVERNAAVSVEILRIFVLCEFSKMSGHDAPAQAMSSGALLRTLDQILNDLRIVDGDAADATFEFGRDVILSAGSVAEFRSVINHELGHHVVEALLGGQHAGSGIDASADVEPVVAALPAMLIAAAQRSGQPMERGDPRGHRLPDGLSVLVSLVHLAGGTYTHLSLTDAAGPIDRDAAALLAYCVVRAVAADPADACVAYSPRGVFHLGLPGKCAVSCPVDDHATAASGGWLAGLAAAGRVGTAESDVAYGLGLAVRPPTAYGATSHLAWADWQRRAAISNGVAIRPDALADTFQLALRIGDPELLAFVVRTGLENAQTERPELTALGTSMLVVNAGTDTVWMGPSVAGLFDVLGVLHSAGYSIDDASAADGRTVLTDAVGRGPELVARLLAVGADPNAADGGGRIPLVIAVRGADQQTARMLLDAGARPSERDGRGRVALHEAAAGGAAELVALLMTRGADVEATTPDGDRALGFARHPDVVKALTAAHAEIGARNNSGDTALHAAAWRRDAAVVLALLDAGADPLTVNDRGEAPLLHAAAAGAVDSIAALLAAGASIEDDSDDGMTPLLVAAGSTQDQAVRLLVQHGADVNASAVDGRTALMLASNGNLEWNRDPTTTDRMCASISVLVAAGADVDRIDDEGRTALMWSVTGFDAGPVELLLDLGANPRIRAKDGRGPLDIALEQEHGRMQELLVAAAARLDDASR